LSHSHDFNEFFLDTTDDEVSTNRPE